jgi:hypothetical protein
MAIDQHSPPPAPEALIKPLARLLRPLVRLLIRSGLTFPAVAEVLRGVFVDVAMHDLLADPKARTDSRISLLTGIHRKDVRRLRNREATGDETPATVTLSSQIIARWLGTSTYSDGAGKPLVLPRTAAEPQVPSFEQLVRSVTTDVRTRAVLDDLVDQNMVILEADDRVRLNTAAFIPRQGGEEQLFYFSRNLHDHIAAAVANVLAVTAPPFLDRSVHYDQLAIQTAMELERVAREAAMRTLIDVNRIALSLAEAAEQGSIPAAAPLRRVNLGIYLYAEDEPAQDQG